MSKCRHQGICMGVTRDGSIHWCMECGAIRIGTRLWALPLMVRRPEASAADMIEHTLKPDPVSEPMTGEELMDPIERGEARIENYIREGGIACGGCDKTIPDGEDMHMISPDPYSQPVCSACLAEWMKAADGRDTKV